MTTDLEQKIGLVTSSSSDDKLSIIHLSIYARSLTNSNVIYVYLFTFDIIVMLGMMEKLFTAIQNKTLTSNKENSFFQNLQSIAKPFESFVRL